MLISESILISASLLLYSLFTWCYYYFDILKEKCSDYWCFLFWWLGGVFIVLMHCWSISDDFFKWIVSILCLSDISLYLMYRLLPLFFLDFCSILNYYTYYTYYIHIIHVDYLVIGIVGWIGIWIELDWIDEWIFGVII